MANHYHVAWLLEGVKSWNERRESSFFTPDFSGENIQVYLFDPNSTPMVRKPLDNANLLDADFTNANLHSVSLVGADLSNANLTNADLQNANLTKANLQEANLTGAHLLYSNLTDANLKLAELTKANLMRANLTKASLWQANLTDATLWGADLTGAGLRETNLDNTNLDRSILTGADLLDWKGLSYNDTEWTDLWGASLAGAELWEASLYPWTDPSNDQLQEGPKPISSIEELMGAIREVVSYRTETLLYFRGESQSAWDLEPSVMRDDLIALEKEMLDDLLSRRPEEFSGMNSALAQWVLAQHHGLRTRFLDVTKNPLVALFHACEDGPTKDGRIHIFATPKSLVKSFNSDTVSVITNFAKLSQHDQEALLTKLECSCHTERIGSSEYREAKRRLYQLIRREKPYFDERIDPRDLYRVFVVEPQQSSERIRAQASAFLMSAFHKRFERNEILEWNGNIPVYAHYTLVIPADAKLNIIRSLELLNVTRETLFPGLDSSAKAVVERYRPQQ